ncbi:2-oxoglutarate-dependent dioxygenase 33 like protein [Verticillium longisporum]|uniref:2-oxoglutarate-dependent dioxygenase 33 like protein n=1 Tax=Verticillium longisporum TaxID=100787 RepID=A0A8I2ZGH1_VERLO|nr:2-oxoglutarate-dependent dioxygenase 33 like protein [Verticillium longisporum]KAG7130723.1 2-oxoglutarate-dependent dioxygenase 33 like protein [Verticillium longisporum]
MAFTSIPLLDLALAKSPSTKPRLLEELRHALLDVGFLYVTNHGVPDTVIANLTAALPKLFGLTSDQKAEAALAGSPHFLGYSEVGTETTAGASDHREQFEFATELTATWTLEQPLAERLRGPNNYPPALPSIRPVVEAYIAELTLLGERFLGLVAEALDLPPKTFLPFLSDQHRLKTVHYPAQPDGTHCQGVGAHKDSSGWWTFLLQASPEVGGLQALNQTGTWVDVPPLAGTFVVNIGQAFEVVTHGVCRATTHRVVSGSEERFSVPFFQGVRRSLTREEAVHSLRGHFERFEGGGVESAEGREVDSAFLRGGYETWGESQLRTKVRSHREVGQRFYGEVFERYVSE